MTTPSPKRIARAAIKSFLDDIDYYDIWEMIQFHIPDKTFEEMTDGEKDHLTATVLELIKREAVVTISFPRGGGDE